MTTQPRVPPRQAFTPWLRRVLARLIDAVPALLLLGAGFAVLATNRVTECLTEVTEYDLGPLCSTGASTAGQLAFTVGALAALGYLVWNFGYRQGRTGSSLGKSFLGFRVVSEKTGQPIGFACSLLRQAAHLVDLFLCYVGYLLPLWDLKRQTLADKMTSTVCIPLR